MAKKKPRTKTRKPARKPAAKKSARAAAKKVSFIPKGMHTATPYLTIRGADKALEFYKKAFGAKERSRMLGPGGAIMHAEITIGDSFIMMGEEMPEMGAISPLALGGSGSGIMLYVKNVDAMYAAAVAAGATADQPPADQFWGDRYSKLTDPFGHKWSIATHIEDLSVKEMQRRGDAFMAQFAQQN